MLTDEELMKQASEDLEQAQRNYLESLKSFQALLDGINEKKARDAWEEKKKIAVALADVLWPQGRHGWRSVDYDNPSERKTIENIFDEMKDAFYRAV